MPTCTLLQGDAADLLDTLPAASVQTCVTSPPYWAKRDYGVDGQLGHEASPLEYVEHVVAILDKVGRVLRPDGTLWLVIDDTYFGDIPIRKKASEAFSATWDPTQTRSRGGSRRSAASSNGFKPKSLCMIPARVAIALQERGWYVRVDGIWNKTTAMPSSARDRLTRSHEYCYLFSRRPRYYYNQDAIREPHTKDRRHARVERRGQARGGVGYHYAEKPQQRHGNAIKDHPKGRNKRTVWNVAARSFAGAHFATYPPDLIEPCILAGSRPGDTVIDPFNGAGTTGVVALKHGRNYIGIDLKDEYLDMTRERLAKLGLIHAEEVPA